MPKYPFLSDEWVDEARRIYAQAEAEAPLTEGVNLAPARINLIVSDAPFAPGPIQAHVDTSGGRLHIDTGHVDKPDVTISMAYDTARSLFVAGNAQSVMQAFLGGRIRVDGDLTKLLDPRIGIFPANPGMPGWAAPAAGTGLGGTAPATGALNAGSAGPAGSGPAGSGPAVDPDSPGAATPQERDPAPATTEVAVGSAVGPGAGEGPGEVGPAAGQARLGFALGPPGAQDIAARLQEITE